MAETIKERKELARVLMTICLPVIRSINPATKYANDVILSNAKNLAFSC